MRVLGRRIFFRIRPKPSVSKNPLHTAVRLLPYDRERIALNITRQIRMPSKTPLLFLTGRLKLLHGFQESNRVRATGYIGIHYDKPRITQVLSPSLHLSLNAVTHIHKHDHVRRLENYFFSVDPRVRELRIYDICSTREPYDVIGKTGRRSRHQGLGIHFPEHFVGNTPLLP